MSCGTNEITFSTWSEHWRFLPGFALDRMNVVKTGWSQSDLDGDDFDAGVCIWLLVHGPHPLTLD